MAPKSGTILPTGTNLCYFNNAQAERSFCRGGYYYSTTGGFASFNGYNARSHSNGYIGFRSAYCELPTA